MTIIPRLTSTILIGICAAACMPLASHAAQQPAAQPAQAPQNESITVAFSDPGRVGKVEVQIIQGSIAVKGTDRKDVLIQAHDRGGRDNRGRVYFRGGRGQDTDTPSTTGLRRLPQAPSFSIEEQNNRIEVSAQPNQGFDFEIEVPRRANLHLSTVNGGSVTVDSVEGDLEINNVNGPVTLNNVGGSVVAQTVNGRLVATLTRITEQKSMAFTTLNGAVDVTLPASIKATFKLRSDNGDVFTDFDLNVKPSAAASVEDTRRTGGKYRLEVNRAIYGTVNGGGPEIELRSFSGAIFLRKGR